MHTQHILGLSRLISLFFVPLTIAVLKFNQNTEDSPDTVSSPNSLSSSHPVDVSFVFEAQISHLLCHSVPLSLNKLLGVHLLQIKS